jgi:hypothetical protein
LSPPPQYGLDGREGCDLRAAVCDGLSDESEDGLAIDVAAKVQCFRIYAKVLSEYSQLKLQMKREALKKLNWKADEGQAGFDTERPN